MMKPNDGKPMNVRRLAILIGSFALALNGVWAQETPAPAAETTTDAAAAAKKQSDAAKAAEVKPAPAPAEEEDEDLVTLSPFVIDASKDIGYYAENTLSGSRLNTKLSDLAPSITVVTKQQMEDTASVDLNDVFRYEANTEGSSTYTPSVQSLRNDGVVDVNAGYTQGGSGTPQTNSTANRVRGLGIPSSSIGFYPSISQVPVDSYNVQSIEISRGPNSMLFGMGSPAGVVNLNSARAVVGRDGGTLGMRVDHLGSFRAWLSGNKSLVDDKLAVMGAYVSDKRQFERKPSYDKTERFYAAMTFRPTKKTNFHLSLEDYSNDNRRPNSLTPRDLVTEWRNAGRPVYDNSTSVVRFLDSSRVVGPILQRTDSPRFQEARNYVLGIPGYNPALRGGAPTGQAVSDTNFTTYNGVNIYGDGAITTQASAFYVPGIAFVNAARPTLQVADGTLQSWFQTAPGQYRQVYGTATDPSANAPLYPAFTSINADPVDANALDRRWASASAWSQTGGLIGSYNYPGVTDKSIYDWTDVNILQMNFGADDNVTYNIEFDQEILPNLTFNAGWFRQDFDSVTNYTVSQLNVATLFVDTNMYMPDGSANPYFGQPYVEDFDPDRFVNTQTNNNYRMMLAYMPDFTKNDGITRWLGRHQLLGLWSKTESIKSLTRQRLHFTSGDEVTNRTIRWLNNPNNRADGSATGWSYANTSARRAYYLGEAGASPTGAVTTSSGTWDHAKFTGDVTAYNFDNNTWEGIEMTQEWVDRQETTARNERNISSKSFGITSYWWQERLITTFGYRTDENEARTTTNGVVTAQNGTQLYPAMSNPEKWINGIYQTEIVFNRWNKWDRLSGDTKTLGGVFKPFKGWTKIENGANEGSFLSQFLRDFGVSYNESDNFNPPDSAQVDVFGQPLPKPTGEGTDYGFQFSLFDNKLFARFNWFESSNKYERTSPGTSISRLTGNVDTNLFRNYARTIARINRGHDPRLESWNDALTADEEAAVQAATAVIWGQPYDYYTSQTGAISATRSAVAEGAEVQVTYNPKPNWTIKVTGGKQDTKYSDVLNEFDAWYDHRSPNWDNATAAAFLLPQYQSLATYTTAGGRNVDLRTFWSSYGYTSEIYQGEPNGNYNAQIYYDGVVTPQYMLARDLEGQSAPGQRMYRASALSTYSFNNETLKGFSIGGSARWEDKAVIGYYGKSSGANANPAYVDISDTDRPIYDDANTYVDLWASYTRKIFDDEVRMKIQLNVVNVFESGSLRVTRVNYDASPSAFRIIDPRQIILTTTFDF
jgi:outer membrane receptor protein involved in Fe transport